MKQPEIILILRGATGAEHLALEGAVNLEARLSDPERRRALVAGFYGFHADAEHSLAPWLEAIEGLDFAARRRLPRIGADLLALGGKPAPSRERPTVSSLGYALGLFYVLEGSSLGGRVIHKQLSDTDVDQRGLSFFDPYGDQTGAQWRTFIEVLGREHAAGRADAEEIVAGAMDGFRLARMWLTE